MAGEVPALRILTRFWDGPLRAWVATAAMTGVVVAVGCEPAEVRSGPANDFGNLRGIARYYAMAARDLGRPPASVAELKNIVAPLMTDPDSVFRSQRDGQEYLIIWGVDVAGSSLNAPLILAYERTGVDGKRLVVTCAGDVKEVSESEFAKLKFAKGHKPQGART